MLKMHQIALDPQELTDIARVYGKVYETAIGEVCYTKLVKPDGFVLLAKDDQLRFYMFRRNIMKLDRATKTEVDLKIGKGVWELVWGASSIVHDGLPVSEQLIQWRLNQALRAGKQGLNEAEALGKAELNLAATAGTEVHHAVERLLNGKDVILAGLPSRIVEHITSVANFINDHEIGKLSINEQIVAYDKTTDGVRVVYAGTTDWIVQLKNEETGVFELWLIDFKTSADAYLSHKLQALAYKEAAEQSLGLKIDRVGILLLGRSTKNGYKLVEVGRERPALGFKDFELVYRMLLLINKGKLPAPSYKTYPKSIKLSTKESEDVLSNTNSDTDLSPNLEHREPASPSARRSVRKDVERPGSPASPRRRANRNSSVKV